MTRSRLVFAGVVLLAAGIGCAAAWEALIGPLRAWERERPVPPRPVGARAPGLDARLDACARRFAVYPPDQHALEEFARVAHASAQYDAAQSAYGALAGLQPRDPRWPYMLAVIHAGYGRLEAAVPLLRQSAALAPDHLAVWLRLGAACLKSDDLAEARSAYDAALSRDRDNPHALLGLARCALREERWTAARSLLQRAVAADANLAPAFHLLATVHERLGNAAAAAACLARADGADMEVEPPDPWLDELHLWSHDTYRLRVVAASALAAGREDRALSACERAVQLAPDDARIRAQLGRTLLAMNRADEARVALELAVDLDPGEERAQLDLIELLRQTGDTSAAASRTLDYNRRFGSPHP